MINEHNAIIKMHQQDAFDGGFSRGSLNSCGSWFGIDEDRDHHCLEQSAYIGNLVTESC